MAMLVAGQVSGAELAGENDGNVSWLSSRAAELNLYTGNDYLQYQFNGDGTRNNATMPGELDMLAVNFFSIYYDLAEGVDITSAALQYMIYPADGNGDAWNTIECTEVNTLVSARKNTHRSTFNEQRLISRDLAPGNYVLQVKYQLVDNNDVSYYFGDDSDNFRFTFTVNEPKDPEILSISMVLTPTPGEQQFPWVNGGEPFEEVDLTNEEPVESMTVDEVFIFAEGNFDSLSLGYKLCDVNGNEVYHNAIATQLDDFGNWSTEEPTELLNSTLLQNGQTYDLLFWAEGEAEGQTLYLNNDGAGYRVAFTFGGGGSTVRGDVNGDGAADIEDVNLIINMMLGKDEKNAAADINGDGEVDVEDMNTIINIMLGKD
ncbi:MAG: dockerin type I repeat-containing protein [Muribaculaceae bacterium]|nr:dockerin type I repeat-containing protein [Muribaculaceae bacterium]